MKFSNFEAVPNIPKLNRYRNFLDLQYLCRFGTRCANLANIVYKFYTAVEENLIFKSNRSQLFTALYTVN